MPGRGGGGAKRFHAEIDQIGRAQPAQDIVPGRDDGSAGAKPEVPIARKVEVPIAEPAVVASPKRVPRASALATIMVNISPGNRIKATVARQNNM